MQRDLIVMNDFNLTILDFDGPLDLLLHLIKESKMNIYDLKIEEITKQYIDYINSMKKLNIDVASEYLVMASDLAYIKSKMLINEGIDKDEDTLDGSINSEEELKQRLLEYQMYKDLTSDFKELESKRGEVLTKIPESLNEYKEDIKLNTNTTLDDLVNAFNHFLDRQKYNKKLDTKITQRELSVAKRSSEIKAMLEKHKRLDFFELFDIVNKPYVVVTFLSVLDMAKNNLINIKQDNNFDNIIIEMK
jgi:segregation and condensation protein A